MNKKNQLDSGNLTTCPAGIRSRGCHNFEYNLMTVMFQHKGS